ncbi:hypothetical protein ACUHGC_10710 [Testudinibacter sp. P27/CKL/0425]
MNALIYETDISVGYHLFLVNILGLTFLIMLCLFCYLYYEKSKRFIWCLLSAAFWLAFIYRLLRPDHTVFDNGIPLSKLDISFLIAFIFCFNIFLRHFIHQPTWKSERYSLYFSGVFMLLLWIIPPVFVTALLSVVLYLMTLLLFVHVIALSTSNTTNAALLKWVLILMLGLAFVEFLHYLALIQFSRSLILYISLFATLSISAILLLNAMQSSRSPKPGVFSPSARR